MADQTLITLPPPPEQDPVLHPDLGTNKPIGMIGPTGDISLYPKTAEALTQSTRNLVPASGKAGFVARNIREGVPLDIETGMPGWDYLSMQFERVKANQLSYLQSKGYNPRLADTGEIIIQVQDSQTGKPKDVLANPKGMSLYDFIDLTAYAPEVAGGILAATKGRVPTGFWPKLLELVKVSAGSEIAGGLKDVGSRAIKGQDINLSEIFQSRATMGAADIGLGGTGAIAGKVLTKAVSPFTKRGPLQFDFESARQYFKAKGFDLTDTIAESTGNPLLMRLEMIGRQTPGSSVPFDELVSKNAQEVQKILNEMLGFPETATLEDWARRETAEAIGGKVSGAIGAKNLGLEGEVAAARQKLQATGSQAIERMVNVKGGAIPRSKTELTDLIRQKTTSEYSQFEETGAKLYGIVESNPLVQQKNISGTKLAQDADSIYNKLVKRIDIIETDTGLMDQFNNPILKTEKGESVVWEFVPSGIKEKLVQLRGFRDQEFKLDELLQVRRSIRDSIKQAEAIPGVQTHILSEMENMVDKRVREGLDELGDPALKQAWETANDFWAKGKQRFNKYGLSNILKDPEQPGYLGNVEFANRLIRDPDWFKAFKEFLGPSSQEFKSIKRLLLDDLTVRDPITGMVNGSQFFQNLAELQHDKPEIAKELFGSAFQRAIQTAKTLSYAGKKTAMNIDAEELAQLVGKGDLTTNALMDLISAENKRAQTYLNSLRSAVKAGTIKPDSIKPSEFVRYMMDNAEPAEVKEVLALISDRPELLEDIRRTALEQVFNRASSSPVAKEQLATRGVLSKEITASGLERAMALDDRVTMDRLKSMLGQETWNDLDNLRKYLKPRELKEEAFSQAGALSSSMNLIALEKGGIFKFAETALKNLLFATIYTNPLLKAWAKNKAITPQEAAAFGNFVIASTPFIHALMKEYGENAVVKARELKYSIDRAVNEMQGNQPSVQGIQPSSVEQLLGPKPKGTQ